VAGALRGAARLAVSAAAGAETVVGTPTAVEGATRLACGGGSGAARTTLCGPPPPARVSGRGVVSVPSVTSVGRVTAAASAVPATAAVAMIVRPLLTSFPVSADARIMVSAGLAVDLNCES